MKPLWITIFLLSVMQQSQAWKNWKRPVCDPVKCDANCREVSNPRGCPTCLCEIVPQCGVPNCPPGCKVQTDFTGPCPGCDCLDQVKDKVICDPVKCTGQCREAVGPNGCPMCLCDPLCSPPKCGPGCVVQTVFEGPCPGCKCDDGGISDDVKLELIQPVCDPPRCPPGCQLETVFEGPCPGCKCDKQDQAELIPRDPLCSPPLCPPGCELEFKGGPCPSCNCQGRGKDGGIVNPGLTKALCDPVKCGAPCREVVGRYGCPTCLCGPLCSPPKCPPGCEIGKIGNEPCPGCKCKQDIVPPVQCSPPKCGPGCEIEQEFEGPCPGCKCDLKQKVVQCSPPKCGPGCEIEQEFDGPCPGCKCDLKQEFVQCSPPKCDPGCEIEQVFDGPCPGCKCGLKQEFVQCSPPKCDPGCEIEQEFEGPCPGCKCELKQRLDLQLNCPQLLDCKVPCKVERDEKGCPKCVCDPQCNVPLCQEGCVVKQRRGEPCPSCYCPKRWGKTG